MINKLKTFATAILVTGATVAATSALATDTNTFTNVIQNVNISLMVYSNAPTKSATSISGQKVVTINSKSIIAALNNASANIPSLVGFDFGKNPQLVIDTTYQATNSPIYKTNAVVTNTVTLSVSNNDIAFQGTNVAVTTGTNVEIVSTNGSAMITNNAVGTNGGTNVLTVTGTWIESADSVSTTNFAYLGANGFTNLSGSFPTNVGVWTVITAATNGTVTNVTAITYTNFVSGTATNYVTNGQNTVEVEGGTPSAPTFADVSAYVYGYVSSSVTNSATGTDFGTTNATLKSETDDAIKSYSIGVFGRTGSSVGDNLSLNVSGFSKPMYKYDVLHQSKGVTNEVVETTSTASVSGSGFIGGTYVTNISGTNIESLPATEYFGTNTSFTNQVGGVITNPIPVVVEGTISISGPKSVAQ
jgi:hypothetical protein